MMNDRDIVFDKPMTYEDVLPNGRVMVTYRGSALGSCIGALVRSRMGITASPPSDFMQGKFDEGSDWEERVIEAAFPRDDVGARYSLVRGVDLLSRFGTVIDGGSTGGELPQVEVTISTGKTTQVKLHPDAFVVDKRDGTVHVVEVKFLSEGFAKTKSEENLGELYEWQFAAEMVGTGLPGLYVIATKDVDEGKNVVGISGVTIMHRPEPRYDLAAIRARVNDVEKALRDGVVPACPLPLMYPCGYWAEHETPEEVMLEDDELRRLVDGYVVEKRMMENLTARMDERRAEIENRLGELESDGGKVKGTEVPVSVTRVAGGQGNVSWKNAYEALAQVTKKSLPAQSLDRLRGKPKAASIRIEIEKQEANG